MRGEARPQKQKYTEPLFVKARPDTGHDRTGARTGSPKGPPPPETEAREGGPARPAKPAERERGGAALKGLSDESPIRGVAALNVPIWGVAA